MVKGTWTVTAVFWIVIQIFHGQVDGYEDKLYTVKTHVDVWRNHVARITLKGNKNLNCTKPESYVCEVPPTAISPDSPKYCNYRNSLYQEQVYRWVAGWGCLLYTPPFLYFNGSNPINMNTGCFYGELFAPCLEIVKSDGTCGCYPFDPGLPEVLQAVSAAHVPSARGRWEQCFLEADACCRDYMQLDYGENVTYCEATFDAWTCWPNTEAETIASQVCSDFAYSNTRPSCHHYSSKTCFANGTWDINTDFSTCSITSRLLSRYQFHIAILSFSIASCLPAVFIFFFYKRLRVTRVALHRNLLLMIILRNIAVIISRSVIYIDELTNNAETVMTRHGVACRFLAIMERAAANAVFVCMLIEGIYLHRLIVAVFRKQLGVRLLYGVGAAITILPVIVWASVMGTLNDHSCWLVYSVENVQWILDAPRVAILLLNTFFFVDILRVLLTTKMRSAESNNQLNTTKATLFLMPLFGSQFLLTALRPNTTECLGEELYYYITYTIEGFQGFIVAMLYCYVNKEVHTLIKATYKKTESAVVSRMRRDSTYPRSTLGNLNSRRMTFSTNLEPQQEQGNKHTDLYSDIQPKLHRAEIISIEVSERVAEILDPIYETVTPCHTDNYDCLNAAPHKSRENTCITSSASIDQQDSRISSIYGNSLNEYEVQCMESNFSLDESDYVENSKDKSNSCLRTRNRNIASEDSTTAAGNSSDDDDDDDEDNDDTETSSGSESETSTSDSESEDSDFESIELNEISETGFNLVDNEILQQIMQDMKKTGHDTHAHNREGVLDAAALAPNRRSGDRIIFIDDI